MYQGATANNQGMPTSTNEMPSEMPSDNGPGIEEVD